MSWHPHPTEIRFVEDDDTLHITFSDDEEFAYDTVILRGYCPCAHCQGHGSRPLKWNPPKNRSQIVIDDISQVGNYAICIAWADGHNTGVYSFEFLREMVDEERCEEMFEEYPPERPEV
ncbi:MAG: gamma-butyrobetaine hydroxylase-like domain-containing protein [Persicimonas sp.]